MSVIEDLLKVRFELRKIPAVTQYNNRPSTVASFHNHPWKDPQEIFRHWVGTDADYINLNEYLKKTYNIIINCGEHFSSHHNLVKFICADSDKEAMAYVSPTKATHWGATPRFNKKFDPYGNP